jgi:epoxyqueuosine reductase
MPGPIKKREQLNTEILKKLGLNIFASVEVSQLPNDILEILTAQNIPYEAEDTLCIIGNGGRDLWEHLTHPLNEMLHPIDNFSIETMKKLEDNIQIIFPHPQWNIPLQRIARFLNISRPSLLGLDINKDFGLWFAFRGAFLTKIKIGEMKYENFNSPCETCETKPCISACPSKAIATKGESFKLNLCADHRLKIASSCADRCLARIACPYQEQHQYKIQQIQYHMTRKAHLKKLSNYIS